MRPDQSSPSSSLVLTGERTLPDIPDERYWFERHVVAYRLAASRARDLVVVDAGCGEGYGTAAIADAGARDVTGVDIEADVVAHARERYAADRPNLRLEVADLTRLPVATGNADLVVSLQVIEHLHDVPAFLAEVRRVLRPSGEFVVTTPNRLTFSPGDAAPTNPFHIREFDAAELRAALVDAGFRVNAMLGVHHGRLIRGVERTLRRPLTDVLASPPDAWPRGVRRLVHRVRHTWFDVRADRLDASLDLVALARAPRDGDPTSDG